MTADQEAALRAYAAGDVAWRTLRHDGWRYSELLSGLGDLGLRAPVVREDGPNGAAIGRGRAQLRGALSSLRG